MAKTENLSGRIDAEVARAVRAGVRPGGRLRKKHRVTTVTQAIEAGLRNLIDTAR